MGNPIEAKERTIRTAELTVDTKTVCIVVFRSQRHTGQREIHYQVTLDPELVSPSGQFIRLGRNHGDEIVGWQPIQELVIVEKLAEWVGDTMPELPKKQGALTFDFERITDDMVVDVPALVSGD